MQNLLYEYRNKFWAAINRAPNGNYIELINTFCYKLVLIMKQSSKSFFVRKRYNNLLK